MFPKPKIPVHLFLSLPLLVATGCELSRMELDPALAQTRAMPVKGNSGRMWNRKLEFGSWRTAAVKEGWTRDHRRAVSIGEVTSAWDKLSKKYRFELPTASGPIEAQCGQLGEFATHTRAHGNDSETAIGVDIAALRKLPPLDCTYDGAGGGRLTLLKQNRRGPLTHDGDVEFEGQHWHVNEVFRLEGAPRWSIGPLSGFEIRRDDAVIAAVEVINGGRVWISPRLSQLDQDRAAAVITALLLFQPLEVVQGGA